MKNILTIVLLTALLPAREIYKQVRVHSDTPNTIFTLQESGLDIDHSHREPGKWIEFSVSASRIYLLDETELSYEIIYEDLEQFYASRLDDEYESRNIIDLARYIQTNEFEAVFGSRSIKCLNLNDRIRLIYRGKRWPYLISKYGGFSLSVLTLLLFNRFVIDPLTGLKAFDRRVLKKLDLKANGVELETEIIAKLSQAQKYILEVPVEYHPRLKSEGKKITIRDGLYTLLNLLKMRFLDRR